MGAQAQYVTTNNVGHGSMTVANTNRDGTGTVVTCFTAGSSGSKVNEIRIKATGQTAAGLINLFVYDGSSYRLLDAVTVDAVTPNTTTDSWEADPITFANLDLESGDTIVAAPTVAPTSGAFHVIVLGGDL